MSAGNDWTAQSNLVTHAASGLVEALTALGVNESDVTVTALHHQENASVGAVVVKVRDDAENLAGVSYTVIVV